jgi:dihydrolipoamide dehydrogenase
VVIGAGPAGYVCAIRCAQLGLKAACVDNWRGTKGESSLGGTCLNVGCIPSKALLEASEVFARVRDHGAQFGVRAGELALDLTGMMAHKDKVVGDLTRGVAALFKSNGVSAIFGTGKLLADRQVEVTQPDGTTRALRAEHIVLATGSQPVTLAAAPLQDDIVVDSTGALAFTAVPQRLGIIGAGVIGLELGSVWRRLGAQVVLLEAQEKFLAFADEQIAKEALKQFTAQGLDIRLGARVTATRVADRQVAVDYQDKSGEHQQTFDRLIVAVGRRPNTHGLFAPEAGLLLDEWGFIHVDEQCRTNLPAVYAVGDVVRGPMLAHKGSEEGIMVAEVIAGGPGRVNYGAIPSVVYTLPEIAWAGQSEQALKTFGTNYRSGSFPFAANGRAKAMGEASGFIKILADAASDRVLGVHVIGPHASELIATAVLAMEFGAAAEDIALTMFAHPTLSEAMHEAALSVHGRAIHVTQAKRRGG